MKFDRGVHVVLCFFLGSVTIERTYSGMILGEGEAVIYWKYLHRPWRDENTRKVSRTSYARAAFIRILSSQECVVYIEPRYASSPRGLFLLGKTMLVKNAKFPQPFHPPIIPAQNIIIFRPVRLIPLKANKRFRWLFIPENDYEYFRTRFKFGATGISVGNRAWKAGNEEEGGRGGIVECSLMKILGCFRFSVKSDRFQSIRNFQKKLIPALSLIGFHLFRPFIYFIACCIPLGIG